MIMLFVLIILCMINAYYTIKYKFCFNAFACGATFIAIIAEIISLLK